MAVCDVDQLLSDACASGFMCLDETQERALRLQLLCNLAAGGGGGGTAWGSITGTLSNQTDLQTALDAKFNDTGDTISPAANTTPLTISGYSLTGANAQGMVAMSGTWNTSGTPTAIDLNITDTASNAASLFLNCRKGGTSQASINKFGGVCAGIGASAETAGTPSYCFKNITTVGFRGRASGVWGVGIANGVDIWSWAQSSLTMRSNGSFGFSLDGIPYNGADISLFRDAAGTLAQRVGTAAQVHRIYRTFTDASNYERLALQTSASGVILAAETAGTGTDNLDVILTPAGTGNVSFPGGVLLKTTAALTDGAAAATGTLLNAPAAGNPTKWIPINDNGTTRYIPAW